MAERRSHTEPRAIASLAVLVAAGVTASVGCVSIDDRPTVQAGESGQGPSSGGTSGSGGSGAKGGSGGTTTSGGTGGATGGTGGKGGATSGGTGGTGGSSAKGGTGGTTGGATSGGTGGTSAAGGTGGTTGGTGGSRGGTGGSGGTGGTSGTSGTTCGDDVSPTAARVRTCVYSLSCNPLVPFSTMSGCLTYGLYYDCNEGATSCADVEACSGVAREPTDTCAGASGWRCEGDVAIRCDGEPYSVDCARLGGTCDLFESTEVTEYRFPCKAPAPSTCSPDDPTSYTCADKYSVSCIDGKSYGTDCTAWGATCIEPTPGYATCSTTKANCDAPETASCVANAVQYCDSDGRLGVYDCGPAGATCAPGAYCLSPGCTTADADACEESCIDETHAQACVGGAPYVIDCTDYGFKACITYTDSTSMTPYVECTMQEAGI